MRGGPRRGAGRPKGSGDVRTKAKVVVAQKAAEEGISPVEVMLRTMRQFWKDAEVVDESTGKTVFDAEKARQAVVVAQAVAPYCHAKVAPKEPPLPPPVQDEATDLRIAGQWICLVLAATGHGQKSLSAPKKEKAKA